MEWHLILAGVVTGAALHEIMEPMNILQKLQRLETAIKTGKVVDPMMKGIDTRAKAYALGFTSIAVLSLFAYVGAKVIDPSVEVAIQYSVVVTLFAEIILMARIDKYHVDIEKMTRHHKKK